MFKSSLFTNQMFNKKFSLKVFSIGLILFISLHSFSQKPATNELTKNDSKIEGIIEKMTLEEKVAMLHGNTMFTSAGVERLGIPDIKYTDGPFGIREEMEKNSWTPLNLTTDSATFFPTGSALAATWSPDMAYLYGKGMGAEAKTRGKDVLLAPAINITRIPTGGRTFEYLSEDPHLTSRLTIEYVKGVQDQGVAACVKHFVLNNQETNRGRVNVIVDERTMREIYLPPFEAAVKEGNAYTIMSAYNKVAGEWCAENDYLQNKILRDEWGFKGFIVSDWGGVHSTVQSAMSGLEVEMGAMRRAFMGQPLLDSIKAGVVPVEIINEKVKRILRVRFAIEPTEQTTGLVSTPEHGEIVYKIASKSIVLLKNVENILPLNITEIDKIAVIGDNAIHTHAHGGFGAGVKARYEVTPLEGLKNRVGNNATIEFAQGYKPTFTKGKGFMARQKPVNTIDTTLLKEAVELAKNSDVAIIFAGTNHDIETEGTDRTDIKIPFGQEDLIEAVAAVNPNTIVVMVAAAPLELNRTVQAAPALLFSWFNGSEGGNALADILLGKVNPSGKLPLSFPASLNDSPAYAQGTFPGKDNIADYKEGSLVGYRWFDTKNIRPQFPFGYGLSYSTFAYNDINTNKDKYKSNQTINVTIDLKNTGNMDGDEVVQLYVQRIDSKLDWPTKELKAFKRVTVKSGETQKVILEIPVSQLRYWNVTSHDWSLENGKIKLMVGSSSANIYLTKTIEI